MDVVVAPQTTWWNTSTTAAASLPTVGLFRATWTRIRNSPGFSTGKWLDEDGGGRRNTFEVATRGGPPRCRRHCVANNTIVKERTCVDNADRNLATTISP
jgi:hypothetical protein